MTYYRICQMTNFAHIILANFDYKCPLTMGGNEAEIYHEQY